MPTQFPSPNELHSESLVHDRNPLPLQCFIGCPTHVLPAVEVAHDVMFDCVSHALFVDKFGLFNVGLLRSPISDGAEALKQYRGCDEIGSAGSMEYGVPARALLLDDVGSTTENGDEIPSPAVHCQPDGSLVLYGDIAPNGAVSLP